MKGWDIIKNFFADPMELKFIELEKKYNDLEKKYLTTESPDLYNQLNRELYRWMYKDSPHILDDNIENYITQAYTYNSLVYAIINYMSTTGASVGWCLEQTRGEEVEKITDHEFLDLWNNPNEDQTTSEFIEACLIYKYSTGINYIYAPKVETGPNTGKRARMEVFPSHVTTPVFGDTERIIDHYVLKGQWYDKTISADDVLNIKFLNPDVQNSSPAIGMSPLKSLLTVITQNNDAWMYLAKSFQNGGPPGFLSKDGSDLGAEFTEEQAKVLVEKLSRENAGPHRANKIAAIGQNVKYTRTGLSPVDLNILESIKVSFIQICNAFKFPAPLLNFDNALTYNNFAESQKILWTVALKQDLDVIGQKITNKVLPAYGEGLRLRPDYSKIEVLQKNKAEMVNWLSQAYWLKGSRKQEIMGEEVDPEMDKYFIPAGVIPVDVLPDMEEVEENIKRLQLPKYG